MLGQFAGVPINLEASSVVPTGRAAGLMAIEAGMKIPVTSFMHVRLLGRLPVTLMTGKTEILCIEPHGCGVSLDGKPLVQFELMGGLGVSF